MKIAVIGAGVSGLTAARLLSPRNNVKVFESSDRPGGLIKCRTVDGSLFHMTGGHVFNTKRKDVMYMFTSIFDPAANFTKTARNSAIIMPDGTTVGYPIENHVYQLGDTTLEAFIADVLDIAKGGGIEPANFRDFLVARFGQTLYDLYFGPYNTKIWRSDLSNVPLSWLEGKLPMPTPQEMIFANIRRADERKFVHSTFYYPHQGGSQTLAYTLAEGLDVEYNHPVQEIRHEGDTWYVDNEPFDRVIYTGNIKRLPGMLSGDVSLADFQGDIDALESHGTTAVFCRIDPNPYTWVYLPSDAYRAHRVICTGNFAPANNAPGVTTATVEFTDKISLDEIMDNLSRIPFHPVYLDHHYERHTYPIQNHDTRSLIADIDSSLNAKGMNLLGRFAQWEYYNMDAAMGAAIDLVAKMHDRL